MYRFLENFETGIPFIDNGHRRLLEDMEEARVALAADHEDEYHRLSGQLLATMHDHIVKRTFSRSHRPAQILDELPERP